jgi:hypothetical protein
VDVVAVELDDEVLGGPERVWEVGAEGLVHLRARQSVLLDEGREAAFHRAPQDGLADLSLLLERAVEGLGPFASGTPPSMPLFAAPQASPDAPAARAHLAG